MYLYHYFDRTVGPFVSLSDLPLDEAKAVLRDGDSHPTFSPRPREDDWKEYRRQLYTYEEILKIIGKYGLPQDWNDDGKFGPERYVEAHVWSEEPVGRYRAQYSRRAQYLQRAQDTQQA